MDFEFSPEEQKVIDDVRAFIKAEVTPELLEELIFLLFLQGLLLPLFASFHLSFLRLRKKEWVRDPLLFVFYICIVYWNYITSPHKKQRFSLLLSFWKTRVIM